MKTIKSLSLLSILTIALSSCNVGDEVTSPGLIIDPVEPPTYYAGVTKAAFFSTSIRFEDQDGQNRFSLFSNIPVGEGYVEWDVDSVSWITTECVRGSDNALMTWSGTYLYYPNTAQISSCGGNGPLLTLCWMDMDMRNGKGRPAVYDETYTIKVAGSRLMSDVHTIKWSIHVEGDVYYTTNCEVDGAHYDFPKYLYVANNQSMVNSTPHFEYVGCLIHLKY